MFRQKRIHESSHLCARVLAKQVQVPLVHGRTLKTRELYKKTIRLRPSLRSHFDKTHHSTHFAIEEVERGTNRADHPVQERRDTGPHSLERKADKVVPLEKVYGVELTPIVQVLLSSRHTLSMHKSSGLNRLAMPKTSEKIGEHTTPPVRSSKSTPTKLLGVPVFPPTEPA